jgi:hypothetical protein
MREEYEVSRRVEYRIRMAWEKSRIKWSGSRRDCE